MKRLRSNFEANFARFLKDNNIKYEYETKKIKYVPKVKTYTPDFYLKDYDILIETKGRFTIADRVKHKLIKEQHPDLDIRFIFQRCKEKLYTGSKTTYADWCDKNDFKYAEGEIPEAWLRGKRGRR
tara:strand:- start:2717 stop:3094 length:378 start_codon:yes stop_codon:yes gene_type:complete